jgi:predicted acyl esterase
MAMAPRRLLWLTIVNGPAVYTLALMLGFQLAGAPGEDWQKAETVIVRSGDARLHARLWRPAGAGPFPAVLLNLMFLDQYTRR